MHEEYDLIPQFCLRLQLFKHACEFVLDATVEQHLSDFLLICHQVRQRLDSFAQNWHALEGA